MRKLHFEAFESWFAPYLKTFVDSAKAGNTREVFLDLLGKNAASSMTEAKKNVVGSTIIGAHTIVKVGQAASRTSDPLCLLEIIDYWIKDGLQDLANVARITPQQALSMFESMVRTIYSVMALHRHGKRIYQVSPGLADELKHTVLKGVRSDQLRLPFPAIYIDIPESVGLSIFSSLDNRTYRANGVYVVEDPRVRVTIDQSSPLVPGLRLVWVGGNYESINEDVVFFATIPLVPGLTVEDILEEQKRQVVSEKLLERDQGSVKFHDYVLKNIEPLFRWVVNVIMYSTSSDIEQDGIYLDEAAQRVWQKISKLPRNSKEYAKRKKELDSARPLKAIYLGRGVPVWSQKDREEASGERKTTVRVLVAGYWKSQHYGPGGLLRKRVFIRPYWRGPEDGTPGPTTHSLRGIDELGI